MATLRPFRGLRYDPARVGGELSRVVAPPYDVISAGAQEECYDAHPQNVIRLILGKRSSDDTARENRYTRAARDLSDWVRKGILVEEKEPCFYVYLQEFRFGGRLRRRLGFLAALKLEPFEKRGVLPHEHVHKGPRADRFELLRHVRANLSPIFSVFSDPGRKVDELLLKAVRGRRPTASVEHGGVSNKLWRVTEPARVAALVRCMRPKRLFIADGHHRYEAALDFRNRCLRRLHRPTGQEDFQYVLSYFVSAQDSGLVILPTHRVLKDLPVFDLARFKERAEKLFKVQVLSSSRALFDRMRRTQRSGGSFGIYLGGKRYLLLSAKSRAGLSRLIDARTSAAWKRLDVVVLHEIIFKRLLSLGDMNHSERVFYTTDAGLCCKLVEDGRSQGCFLLNPTRMEEIQRIASLGERMPPKSTYFYPKLLTGLVMRLIH